MGMTKRILVVCTGNSARSQMGEGLFRAEGGDVVITVCDRARGECPAFAGGSERLHWPFEDPAAFVGTDGEKAAKFREVRDLIDQRIRAWLQERQVPLAASPIQAAAQ